MLQPTHEKDQTVKGQRNSSENLYGHGNLPHSNPFNAYLWNVKTVEVYIIMRLYTNIKYLKRKIKKRAMEHMKKAIFQFRPCFQ